MGMVMSVPIAGPIEFILSHVPSDLGELQALLRNGKKLSQISRACKARYRGTHICPRMVRLILRELTGMPLQDSEENGAASSGNGSRNCAAKKPALVCRRGFVPQQAR